ncbi:MAG: type VII toxin-antitoxin system HepT family RNase toxin [bacterium]
MVDQHVLASRLSALEGYRAKLESFKRFSRKEFLADEDIYELAARYLQLACECVLDLAQHVVAEQGFRQPNDYKDSVEVLREEGVLDDELADRLKGWMGFRNVLVHLYLDVDHGRSYESIHHELGDLDAFARRMATFLKE